MSQHKAALLDGPNLPLSVRAIATTEPGADEVLIRVRAVAINPFDWKVQENGAFIESWPTILGADIAGDVVAVGPHVNSSATKFSEGQRVIAFSQMLTTKDIKNAGFQELVVAPITAVAPLPDALAYEDGVVLPLGVSTAACALFQSDQIGLEHRPVLGKPESNGKTLLVWGGGGSVGMSAIQLAVAAGYGVVTTASPRNFDLLRGLGARAVLDYHSEDIVRDLIAELKDGGEFVGVLDAIGQPETQKAAAQVASEMGGGRMTTADFPQDGLPDNVKTKWVFAPTIFEDHKEIGRMIWHDYMPKALKSGDLKPVPTPEVVGKGLDAIQAAIYRGKAGVSARKIVVLI